MNILILGSCVTMDIFRVANIETANITYYARTSLISIMSAPLKIEEGQIQLNSPFQRRMIICDFNKNFLKEYETNKFDAVIIDFIDERFDLLKHENSYVTKSKEFDEGKVGLLYDFGHILRDNNRTNKLWEYSCLKFIDSLKLKNHKTKFYLHEAYWANDYLNEDNKKCPFAYQNVINKNNILLAQYYEYFAGNMPEAKIIKTECLASTQHTWGLSAYHYTDEYYKTIVKQIDIQD